jgi:hypothetical protein
MGNQTVLNPQKCDTTFHNITLSTDSGSDSTYCVMANTLKGFKAHKTPPNYCTTRFRQNGCTPRELYKAGNTHRLYDIDYSR